jgi:hypothetical protein
MEKIIVADLPRLMSLDLAGVIGSFLKLHFVPRVVLLELNQQ